jgi:hypothetical protein
MKWIKSTTKILLIAFSIACLTVGCKSTDQPDKQKKKGKEATIMRFHLEANLDGTARTGSITVCRSSPIVINIDLVPVLNEGDVDNSEVLNSDDSFSLKIQFNDRGKRILEMVSTANKGKHLAIYSQFGDARWLAAPLITQNITNGVLIFTPDCSLDEARRIVRGLNNVAEAVKKQNKF